MMFLESTTSTVLFVIFAVICQVIVDADRQEISDALKSDAVPSENDNKVHLGLMSNLFDAANSMTLSRYMIQLGLKYQLLGPET